MNKIRVHLADSDYFSQAGISGALASAEDIIVEQITDSMSSAIEASTVHRPDVVILESSLDGEDLFKAVQSIIKESPQTKVVILATKYNRAEAAQINSAGGSGLFSKNSISAELACSLRLITAGYKIFAAPSDGWEATTLSPYRSINQGIIKALGERDRKLIYSVAVGLTNIEISRALHISEGSVKLHLARIMDQLDVTNRVQLAVIATESGLVSSADLKLA